MRATHLAFAVLTTMAGSLFAARAAQAAGGFVWSSSLSGTSTYSANGQYSYNSAGGSITVTRMPNMIGRYRVTFGGLPIVGGNAQVMAYGSGSEYCNVVSWSTTDVNVQCFAQGGTPVDTFFVASLTGWQSGGGPPHGGYVWNASPVASVSAPYYWNSSGHAVEVSRSLAGEYLVHFHDVSNVSGQSAHGTTLVTAYDGSAGAYCISFVDSLGQSAPSTAWTVAIAVRCFNKDGVPADSKFSLAWSTEKLFESNAFSWYDKGSTDVAGPTSSPSVAWSVFLPGEGSSDAVIFGSSGSGTSLNYYTRIPLVASGSSAAIVSAAQWNPTRCKAFVWEPYHDASWSQSQGGVQVTTKCFDKNGGVQPNSSFTLGYGTTQTHLFF
jgi:hypothetical protein